MHPFDFAVLVFYFAFMVAISWVFRRFVTNVSDYFRGGGKAPDAEILDRTEKLMKQGAAGIVYGRNIIQHADPAGMTKALMAIVHDGAKAADAAKLIHLTK